MHTEKGRDGERKAALYLVDKGYVILEKNFRDRRGEIDIVATRGDDLVFIEVKTWEGIPFEELGFSVDRRKIRTIVRESRRYLFEHPEYSDMFIRYDLIFLEADTGRVGHIRNAFTEDGAA